MHKHHKMDRHVDRQTSKWTDLRQHVHAHGIPSRGNKADVDLSVTKRQCQPLKTSKPAVGKKLSMKTPSSSSASTTVLYINCVVYVE